MKNTSAKRDLVFAALSLLVFVVEPIFEDMNWYMFLFLGFSIYLTLKGIKKLKSEKQRVNKL